MTDLRTLIRVFEGLKLKTYIDPVGIRTIGFGHTGKDVLPDMVITIAEADELLEQDIRRAQGLIKKYIKVPLNKYQLDALTSMVFNLGSAPLKGTLGRFLNAGNYNQAADELDRWVHAGGIVLKGLVLRRAAEKKMFLTIVEKRDGEIKSCAENS